MAKTIKEMVHQYVYENCDNDKHAIAVQCAYEAGANAVLEEIEKELPKSDKSLNDYGKAFLWRINERIKELKGE